MSLLFVLRVIVAVFCLCGIALAADMDDYLGQIEAEAKRQAIMPRTTERRTEPVKTLIKVVPARETKDQLPLGLTKSSFEVTLRDEFAGAYHFYQKLGAKDQQRIFEFYQQDNRVSIIRKEILRLLLGS